MEIEIRKISIQKESQYTVHELCNFTAPKFIYDKLICLKLNEKYGCLEIVSGKVIVPFKYNEIYIAKNGILKACVFCENGGKTYEFYDILGNYITSYYIEASNVNSESIYLKEDELDISFVTRYEDDEYDLTSQAYSRHILADGTSSEVMGYDIGYIHKNSIKKLSEDIPSYAKVIENPEMIEKDVIEKLNKYYNSNKFVSPFTDPNWVIIKDCIYYSAEGQLKIFDLKQSEFVSLFENKILFPDGYISDKFISYYRSKYSDYNLIVENDHLVALTNQNFAVEIQFGKAKRHKFFVSEEAADEYISEFEEKILDKILKD